MSRDAFGDRALILDRMSKRELVALRKRHHPADTTWTAHPVETWDRASLITSILMSEFPDHEPWRVCPTCHAAPCLCARRAERLAELHAADPTGDA